MARTISDEELQLKRRARRRLIGAVVLVTAIAVVLPMVLDSEPRPAGREVSIQIPAPDSGTFTSKVVPLAQAPDAKLTAKPPADSKPVPKPQAEEKKAVPVEPVPASEAKPEPKPPAKKAQPKPKPKPKPKPAPAKASTPANEPYVVQVIALADAGRAREMQQQLAGSGIKSYTEVVKTAKGDVTRVRAGPYPTREAAERSLAQIKALGLSGNITSR